MTFPAAMRFVRLARIGVASIARRNGVSVRSIDDLRLAIDEVFSLLLHDEDHHGSVDITFEIDDEHLAVTVTQRLANGVLAFRPDDLIRFDVVMTDLVDESTANTEDGIVRFAKLL